MRPVISTILPNARIDGPCVGPVRTILRLNIGFFGITADSIILMTAGGIRFQLDTPTGRYSAESIHYTTL